jgi:cyanophycinase
MNLVRLLLCAAALCACATSIPSIAQPPQYHYTRLGNPTDSAATPRPAFALMGGGTDLDQAFRFLCDHSGKGDFLVLRASGSDDYNPYIQKLCPLNSVATLIVPSRAAAQDPAVAKIIAHASALFISGGDQANYIDFWTGTPLQSALNEAIQRGVPIGGTSAGLAVLGEYSYSAQGDKPDDPNLTGAMAMADPFSPRITLAHGFLDIPQLKGIITDTHFAKRDRMGRLLTFLARLNTQANTAASLPHRHIRGIGIEERAAVLLDPDGHCTVIGRGAAYFIDASEAQGTVAPSKPLTFAPFHVQKVLAGQSFNIRDWRGEALPYQLSVEDGQIHSTQPANAIY